jgi:N-acyl-D-aspartate/D-glutamate deacylase
MAMTDRPLRALLWAPALSVVLVLTEAAAQPGIVYDVVIRNGRVLDGAGNPWILADLAIQNGRFVKLGTVRAKGRTEIDARGRYVSPGWIDMMDHSGGVLLHNPEAENKLRMGVTTVLAGEGGTPVPADSLSGYFAELQANGISLNFGTYFSAAQARIAVLRAENRAPTADELERMKAIVDRAMRAGVLGLTTALIYYPGGHAQTDELVELARVAATHGGIYASHIRGETSELITSIGEAIAIGERARIPVEIFHLRAAYQPHWNRDMPEVGRLIESARARGVEVAANTFPYTTWNAGLDQSVPPWVLEGGTDSMKARLRRSEVRARVKQEIQTSVPGWRNAVRGAGGWNGVVLARARNPENARYEHKTLQQIARERGVADPADALFDLLIEAQTRPMAVYHPGSESDVETALRYNWTSIGSDAAVSLTPGVAETAGLPTPRAYGAFPRVLQRYVRERGTITLEDAIRKMTSWPATRMRLADRGVIREGNWADVVIFDPERIAENASWEKPAEFASGIDYVLVNGRIVIEHGRHTGERPGHVLFGPGRISDQRSTQNDNQPGKNHEIR